MICNCHQLPASWPQNLCDCVSFYICVFVSVFFLLLIAWFSLCVIITLWYIMCSALHNIHVCLDTIQINIFQAIESTISWLMTVPICRSLTKAIVTKWSATKRWSEQIVPHADVFFISTFLKRGHLMIVHLFLTLHTGIALNWGPLQCLQFMNFNDKRSYGIARPNFNKSRWFKSFQRYWSLSDRSILQHLPHQTQTHQRWATLMGDHTIQGEAFSFAIGQTAGNVITFLS